MNIKNIHIGSLIQAKVEELQIPMERIMKFLSTTENEVKAMYHEKSIDTDVLLKWSKLLKFDFFRFYTSHLILYAPYSRTGTMLKQQDDVMVFRKSIYTQEVKDFILRKIRTGAMSTNDIIARYRIPKTTLYKWMKKI